MTEEATGTALDLDRGLVERLRQSASYLSLVAEQIEAARVDDAEHVRQLAEQRARIEDQWRPAASDDDDTETAAAPDWPDLTDLLDRGLAEIEAYFAAERQAEETWSQLADGTARSARLVPAPQPRTRRYPELSKNERRVDVRL